MPGQLGLGSRDRHRSAIGAKVITVFPGNEATPLDSHLGVVLLFEAEMGRLLAIIDASSVTAIRTAAVSGVATTLLANPDAGDLAILGAGVQAMTHLEAMRTVRTVRRIRVWSRTAERRADFVRKAQKKFGTLVEAMDSPESCVQGRRHHLHGDRFARAGAARELDRNGRPRERGGSGAPCCS